MERLTEIWPTWADLATDLKRPYSTVRSWGDRGIPPRHFMDIIACAEARGHRLTFEDLDRISREMVDASTPAKRGAA